MGNSNCSSSDAGCPSGDDPLAHCSSCGGSENGTAYFTVPNSTASPLTPMMGAWGLRVKVIESPCSHNTDYITAQTEFFVYPGTTSQSYYWDPSVFGQSQFGSCPIFVVEKYLFVWAGPNANTNMTLNNGNGLDAGGYQSGWTDPASWNETSATVQQPATPSRVEFYGVDGMSITITADGYGCIVASGAGAVRDVQFGDTGCYFANAKLAGNYCHYCPNAKPLVVPPAPADDAAIAATASLSKKTASKKPMSAGVIVAAVIGGLAMLIALAFLIRWLVIRNVRSRL
jgi:hypothetical protein